MTIEDVQSTCRQLPAVTEDIKWEHDLVFSVGDKMFFVVGLEQTPTSASFKVADEEFDEICSRPGFKPAPYLARHKWVWIEDINKLKRTELHHYIVRSYELVAVKLSAKVRMKLGL